MKPSSHLSIQEFFGVVKSVKDKNQSSLQLVRAAALLMWMDQVDFLALDVEIGIMIINPGATCLTTAILLIKPAQVTITLTGVTMSVMKWVWIYLITRSLISQMSTHAIVSETMICRSSNIRLMTMAALDAEDGIQTEPGAT